MPTTILSLADNITIRPWHPADKTSLAQQANNRKIWLNMTDRFPFPYTDSEGESWITHCNNPSSFLSTSTKSDIPPEESEDHFTARQASSSLPTCYAICYNDAAIGSCGMDADLMKHPRTVSLGYWIGEEYWGRGIATQVALAFTKWLFESFPWIVRVEADAYSWNTGSQNVLKKAGFEFEGVQKLKAFKDGKYGDLILFAKTRDGFVPEIMTTNAP